MEITVRSGGSGDPALGVLAQEFERSTGHVVTVTYDNNLVDGDGKVFDAVFASNDILEREFLPAGMVEKGAVVVGSVKLGVTTRRGAPAPDISTMAAFKRSLVEADAFLTTTHSSGFFIESMLKRIGVYDLMESRIERFANGPLLMDRLAAGEGKEFALLSTNQVRRYLDKGLVLVGLAPEEVQHELKFIVVPMTRSTKKAVAWEFAHFCAGPGRAVLLAYGFS